MTEQQEGLNSVQLESLQYWPTMDMQSLVARGVEGPELDFIMKLVPRTRDATGMSSWILEQSHFQAPSPCKWFFVSSSMSSATSPQTPDICRQARFQLRRRPRPSLDRIKQFCPTSLTTTSLRHFLTRVAENWFSRRADKNGRVREQGFAAARPFRPVHRRM